MGGDAVSGLTSSQAADESWRRQLERAQAPVPVSLEKTQNRVIADITLPSFSPALFQQTPAVFTDLGGLEDPILDQAITSTRARLAQGSSPSRAADELNLKALEQERAKRDAAHAKQQVPSIMADASSYSVEKLEAESKASAARLEKKPFDAAERQGHQNLESALAKKVEPAKVDVDSLKTDDEVLAALNKEVGYLDRFKNVLPTDVRLKHEATARQLEQRHIALYPQQHACDNAKVPTAKLANGAYEVSFTADDLVAKLKQTMPLTLPQEAAVRSQFESWRNNQCAATGEDPTRVRNESTQYYEKDTSGIRRDEMRKRAEMLEASAGSVCAALAFVDSAVRGDTVDAAYARVMGASALSDAAMSVVHAPQEHPDTTLKTTASRVEMPALDGAAARSRFDEAGQAMMNNAEKKLLPVFQPNPGGVTRSMDEAVKIAEKNGVTVPSFIKFVVADAKVDPKGNFADYKLAPQYANAPNDMNWEEAAPGGIVVVKVDPSVLNSDEKIVAVIQHEAFELAAARSVFDGTPGGRVRSARINSLIKTDSDTNFHGRAWDIADSRVLIMRETNPARKAILVEQLEARLQQFKRMSGG